jgi:hypothetical protein
MSRVDKERLKQSHKRQEPFKVEDLSSGGTALTGSNNTAVIPSEMNFSKENYNIIFRKKQIFVT